jgi:CRP-like cAMP-binding protein
VDKRLARFLLTAAKENGIPENEGIIIHLGLTVEDIALAIATSRQTASMLLNRWSKEGIINYQRKSILIMDMDQLFQLAGKETS